MKLLLDTHTVLWWLEQNSRLGRLAGDAVRSPDNDVRVSVVSAWEIAIKYALGRLDLIEAPEELLPVAFDYSGFAVIDVSLPHALHQATLPLHHRDPFDRMLIAQARLDGFTLVTADKAMERYDVPLLAADR